MNEKFLPMKKVERIKKNAEIMRGSFMGYQQKRV